MCDEREDKVMVWLIYIYIYNNWGSTNRFFFTCVTTLNFWKKNWKRNLPKEEMDQSFTNYHMIPGPTRACHVPILKTHFFFSLILIFILSETLISLKAIFSFLLSFSLYWYSPIRQLPTFVIERHL